MNETIKRLMLQAIEEKRPEVISSVCLPIWNQPFFYKIDKAKVLTISYNPTDKGARTNYPYLIDEYLKNGLSSEKIFETLYTFKKENQWRKNYDLIFGCLGFDVNEEIAHMDVSFFPYSSFDNYMLYQQIDTTHTYLLNTIELLGSQLKYIFIDGARNRGILDKLSHNFILHKRLKARNNNNSKKYDLLIYKHKDRDLFMVYYGCFLYGSTCSSTECVREIAKLIQENTEQQRIQIKCTEEVKKGMHKFTIKNGNSPETVGYPVKISSGDHCMLVFDDKECVEVVWKHYDSKNSEAIGQAEIRFFDKYRNEYGLWHRMFVNDQRLMYDCLQNEVNSKNEYIYFGKIKGH